MARRGRRRVVLLCLSHVDRDHHSALPLLLAAFPVERIILPRQPQAAALARRLADHGCRVRLAAQRWRCEPVPGLQLLAPGRAARNRNEGCLVLILDRPGLRLLSPGDLSGPGLDRLIALGRAGALRAPVLVAPHHGAATGKEEELVRALGVRQVLVSRAWWAGPPPAGAAYRRAGARLRWTARCGAITLGSPAARGAR
jgi:beta-lactamase superfamily II metal-dependent hydrolase